MSNPSKKSHRKFITKMLISSREWEIWEDPEIGGGSYKHEDPMNHGKRTIVLGTKDKDSRYHAEVLIHEILEIMFSTEDRRFVGDWVQNSDHTRYLFVFDHDYLHGVGPKLLTALLTSGMFELKVNK